MKRKDWGGIWTERKLDAFEKYVKAYLTIMNNYRDKYNWKLFYFDAFAGSGSKKSEQVNENQMELFNITKEEDTVYRGAAERVVNIDLRGFDYYYFIESNGKSKLELEKKLNQIKNKKPLNLQYRCGDANNFLLKLAETMKNNAKLRSLIMIDPFGMQVNWETIEQLKETQTDLWILIPSGVIINRLLDGKGNLKNTKKLSKYFGLTVEEIKNHFYKKNTSPSLFNIEEYQKIPDPIPKIAELYIKQLHTIFKEVTPKPLKMLNGRNVPIYHFAFASNNAAGLKIANDIIGKEIK